MSRRCFFGAAGSEPACGCWVALGQPSGRLDHALRPRDSGSTAGVVEVMGQEEGERGSRSRDHTHASTNSPTSSAGGECLFVAPASSTHRRGGSRQPSDESARFEVSMSYGGSRNEVTLRDRLSSVITWSSDECRPLLLWATFIRQTFPGSKPGTSSTSGDGSILSNFSSTMTGPTWHLNRPARPELLSSAGASQLGWREGASFCPTNRSSQATE